MLICYEENINNDDNSYEVKTELVVVMGPCLKNKNKCLIKELREPLRS